MNKTDLKLQIATNETPDILVTDLLNWPHDRKLRCEDLGFVIAAMDKQGFYPSCHGVEYGRFSALWVTRRDSLIAPNSLGDGPSFHEAIYAAARNVLSHAGIKKAA